MKCIFEINIKQFIFRTEENKDKEIFMYDVSTKAVSKLNGDLSAAFVEAAETNTNDKETEQKGSASEIVETKAPPPESSSIDRKDHSSSLVDLSEAASDYVESRVPVIDPTETDLDADGSEQFERFVDISGLEVNPNDDLLVAASNSNSSKE